MLHNFEVCCWDSNIALDCFEVEDLEDYFWNCLYYSFKENVWFTFLNFMDGTVIEIVVELSHSAHDIVMISAIECILVTFRC